MKKTLLSVYLFVSVLLMQAVVLAGEHAEEAAHHGNPGPSIATLYRFINFAIFAICLVIVLRKPVKDFFASRSQGIKSLIDQATKAYDESAKINRDITAKLASLEKEKNEMMLSFKSEAEDEKKRMIEQAQKMTERLKSDAGLIAESEIKKAKEELREAAIVLARNMAEKKMAQELSSDDHVRLTRGYLERLRRLH